MRILIIDDSRVTRLVLQDVLENSGYSVDTAESGEKALQFLGIPEDLYGEGRDVDLIMTGLVMTGISGIEVIKKLKASKKHRDIPIIVVTAKTDDEVLRESFETGATDYVNKTFNRVELLARVRSLLRLKQETDKRKEFARSLEEANDNLKTEILERKKAEDEALKSKGIAEDATKMKDKFVSLVSHDLRGPLGNIRGMLEMLVDAEEFCLSEEEKANMAKEVMNVADGLAEMIDQLLDISRLQTGKLTLSEKHFDAKQFFSRHMNNLTHLAKSKGVELVNRLPENMTLYGDQALCGEVIQNLISNAIKFCAEGDAISLLVPEGRPTTIAVKDTGKGIKPAILPDLFKHEVKTTTLGTSGEKGTGLGLPYCRDIMVAHGGSLTVESKEGEGSIFYAEFPSLRPSILFVHNDANFRAPYRKNFDDAGWGIIESDCGEKTVEELKCGKMALPSAVVADVQLPKMKGLKLLEYVKGIGSTPVVILSAWEDPDMRGKALSLGADEFLEGPLREGALVAKIKGLVS